MYLNGLIEDDPRAAEMEVQAAINAAGEAHEHPVVGKVEFILTDYQLSTETRRYKEIVIIGAGRPIAYAREEWWTQDAVQ
jgi:hypothetical protein